MRNRFKSRAARAHLLIIFFLAGCAGVETELNSLSFHEGQAESNEQILLRNIVAAAHDKAPTFIAASQVSSVGKLSGALSATFTDTNIRGHTLTPSMGAERSQNVVILDYGATKAAKQLYQDVPPSVLTQLLLEAWPARVAETILFNGIGAPGKLNEAIRRSSDKRCATTRDVHE